jgi:hypothetical protein
MSGVEVLEIAFMWLRTGRITAGADAISNFACHEYMQTVCAIRSVRRWDPVTSALMLAAVHAGRGLFVRSTYRMVRDMQEDTVAELRQGRVDDAFVIARLAASESELQLRVEALEDEVLDYMRAAQELDVQVRELRAALADVRRAR